MKIFNVFLLGISIFSISSCYKNTKSTSNPLIGKWKYIACTYKYTRAKGTITFLDDTHYALNVHIKQDFPTSPTKRIFDYSIKKNRIHFKNQTGMGKYFIIQGDKLYLSNQNISKVIDDWSGPYRKTNWVYKLKRVK